MRYNGLIFMSPVYIPFKYTVNVKSKVYIASLYPHIQHLSLSKNLLNWFSFTTMRNIYILLSIVELVSGNTLRHSKPGITSHHILSLYRISNDSFHWTRSLFLKLTSGGCWSENASKCECLRIAVLVSGPDVQVSSMDSIYRT